MIIIEICLLVLVGHFVGISAAVIILLSLFGFGLIIGALS